MKAEGLFRWIGLVGALVFVLISGVGAVPPVCAQGYECPPEFEFQRMSGVGCVQKTCPTIANAKYSYTGVCICNDGFKECRGVNAEFDKSKCGPFCPYPKLVSCIPLGAACPGEQLPASSAPPAPPQIIPTIVIKGPITVAAPVTPPVPSTPSVRAPTVSELVHSLEEFLAGQGVKDLTREQVAAAGAAIAALLALWSLANLLSGVADDKLKDAVDIWKQEHLPATPLPEQPPGLPEWPSRTGVPGRSGTREMLVEAVLRAQAEALERQLGRPPTPEELENAVRTGQPPSREEIAAQVSRLAQESQATRTDGPKGWGEATADWVDAKLDQYLPPVQIPIPGTDQKITVPWWMDGSQVVKRLVSGLADSLRLGLGIDEAARVLMEGVKKDTTMSEAAWVWMKSMLHVGQDALRAAPLADGVQSLANKALSGGARQAAVPVLRDQGIIKSLEAERRNALQVLREGAMGQGTPWTCSYKVEQRIVNQLLDKNLTEQQVFFRNNWPGEWNRKIGDFGPGWAKRTGVGLEDQIRRFKSWGLDVQAYERSGLRDFAQAVESKGPALQLNPEALRSQLAVPGTRIKVGVSKHAVQLVDISGSGPQARVWVYNPADGATKTVSWKEFQDQIVNVVVVRKKP